MNTSYAGFFRRAAAYLIDVILLATLAQLTQWAIFVMADNPLAAASGPVLEGWVLLTVSLPAWLYFSLSESIAGQTVGKRLMGLRVSSVAGGRVSFVRALVRTIVKLLPWELTHATLLLPTPLAAEPGFRWGFIVVYVLLGLYLVVMLFNRRKQSVHDLLTGTIVVRHNPALRVASTQ